MLGSSIASRFIGGRYSESDYNVADKCSKRLPKRFMDDRVRINMKFRLNLQRKKKTDAFVSHFIFLGLNRGECRTNVIRSAAQAMSVALSYGESNFAGDHTRQTADDVRRARIAVAAYRLLDPRERTDLYERVQLCYPIDRDDLDTSNSIGKLVDQMPKVPPKIRRQTGTIVTLMGQPLIDEAIEGKTPADEEPEAAKAEKPTNQSVNEPSIEERRRIVRLLRKSDESTSLGLSPLNWLRSRLGI